MASWISLLFRLLPSDADKTAERFNSASSSVGERLRPWLYGLIGAVVVLLLVAVVMMLLAS